MAEHEKDKLRAITHLFKELLDDHRVLEPPDPMPNSEVKQRIADGSVGLPHVRVGHCQAPKYKALSIPCWGLFIAREIAVLCRILY